MTANTEAARPLDRITRITPNMCSLERNDLVGARAQTSQIGAAESLRSLG